MNDIDEDLKLRVGQIKTLGDLRTTDERSLKEFWPTFIRSARAHRSLDRIKPLWGQSGLSIATAIFTNPNLEQDTRYEFLNQIYPYAGGPYGSDLHDLVSLPGIYKPFNSGDSLWYEPSSGDRREYFRMLEELVVTMAQEGQNITKVRDRVLKLLLFTDDQRAKEIINVEFLDLIPFDQNKQYQVFLKRGDEAIMWPHFPPEEAKRVVSRLHPIFVWRVIRAAPGRKSTQQFTQPIRSTLTDIIGRDMAGYAMAFL